MYLLLILLISPAWGRPRRTEIDNQFNSIIEFAQQTGNLLRNSSVIDEVIEKLQVAERDMIQMTAELKTLESSAFAWFEGAEEIESILEEVKTMHNIFSEFNLAKSFVKKTREELRKLAYRTVIDVSEVKPLIEALDQNNGALFFRISINRLKDLIKETLVTLEEAKMKYESGVQIFENIKFKFQIQNQNFQKSALNVNSAIKFNLRKVCQTCETLETFKLFESNVEKLQRISDNMLESINNFEKAIKRASDILVMETDLAGEWNQNAEIVDTNIEEYGTEEYLREFETFRGIFIDGLVALKNSAEAFLSQPKDIDQVN